MESAVKVTALSSLFETKPVEVPFVMIEEENADRNFMFRHLLDEADQQTRLDELLVDSEGWDKGLGAFEIYLTDCLDFPFNAKFRDKKYGDNRQVFTVLRILYSRNKGGVFCEIQLKNKKKAGSSRILCNSDRQKTQA